ncbi:mechanosensitive ion channel family protein [Haploplasma axanthum]|nr:mechanosensitive ion channel domain-containing protein [Haploplasma axanthum]
MNIADQIRNLIKKLFEKFITNSELVDFFAAIVMIIFWLLLASIVFKLVKRFLIKTKKYEKKETKEQMTVRRLINNIVKALFAFWIVIMILKELGIDIMPVLAGAGVLAFAVGFGAQELIKDVISGFFLIIEKTFSIGDDVEINGNVGTVTDIGIRRTKMQNWRGQVITINNGDIKTVVNQTVLFSVAIIDFKINAKFDISYINSANFKKFILDYKNSNPDIISAPETAVITSFDNGMNLRIVFKTQIRKQNAIEPDFRNKLAEHLIKNNIRFENTVFVKMEEQK